MEVGWNFFDSVKHVCHYGFRCHGRSRRLSSIRQLRLRPLPPGTEFFLQRIYGLRPADGDEEVVLPVPPLLVLALQSQG